MRPGGHLGQHLLGVGTQTLALDAVDDLLRRLASRGAPICPGEEQKEETGSGQREGSQRTGVQEAASAHVAA